MRRLIGAATILGLLAVTFFNAEGAGKDSPAAAATRKKLKRKISVNYSDTRLLDVAADISKQFDNKLSIKLDNVGGVSNNLTITFAADEQPLDKILDKMFAKNQLGYVIISNPKDRRDGFVIIKKGKQRGYEVGDEPSANKDKTDADKSSSKDAKSAKDDDKPPKDKKKKDKAVKDKSGKDKKDKTNKDGDDDSDKKELRATAKLKLAKMLHKDGLVSKAKIRYNDIITEYPGTKAAKEAQEILEKLKKK